MQLFGEVINAEACKYFASLKGAEFAALDGHTLQHEYMLLERARICQNAGVGGGDTMLAV